MDRVKDYHTAHADLMRQWKARYPGCGYFTTDGIVNPGKWFALPEEKRVLFLLKEAYTSESTASDWNEAKWLNGDPCRDDCPHGNCAERCPVKGNSFNRLAEWTYCITELGEKDLASGADSEELAEHICWLGVYDKNKTRRDNNKAYYQKRNELLKKTAIVNLKKADGEKRSDKKSMLRNAEMIEDLLLKQIGLIRPHCVICCGTAGFLSERTKNELKAKYRVIDAPHPNAHISRRRMLKPVLACIKIKE